MQCVGYPACCLVAALVAAAEPPETGRRMREQDEQRNQLLAALKKGEEDIAAGRYKLYSPELQSEIIENAKKKAAEGRKPKRDVTP